MSAAPGSGSTVFPSPAPAPTPSAPTPVPEPVPTPEVPVEEEPPKDNLGMAVGLPISACMLLVFSMLVNSKLQNTPVSETQLKAAHWFEKLAIGGKGGLILALIILAVINGHSSYVKEHPKQFMQDSLAIGGFGAISAVWLTMTRGRPDLWINHLVFSLMLFFLYNVCREFAGYFTVFGSDKMTDQEQKEKSSLGIPVAVIGGTCALIALVLAIVAHVSPDYSEGILKSLGSSSALAVETVVFVFLITLGEIVVARNKKEPIGKAVGVSVATFTLAHLVLQGGGFYEHLYSAPPPCIS